MKIRAYDPEAGAAAQAQLGQKIEIADDSYAICAQADALVIFTDWQEFRSPDFEAITRNLKRPVIFDGRNLYDPEFMKAQAIEYHSIGRVL